VNKKQKKNLIRICISAVLMIGLKVAQYLTGLQGGLVRLIPGLTSGGEMMIWLVLYLVPYLIVGYDILLKAGKGIKNHQPMDECLLMAIATLGAIVLAVIDDGDFTEAIAVMLFYQIGEWFQSYAVDRSRKNVAELMDICPEYANLEGEDGSLEQVDPDEVEIGSIIVVKPGERIPIDGVVIEGQGSLDTAALTGESVPRNTKPGDQVISGCVNLSSVLRIRTEKEYEDSTVARVLELIEDASSRKARSEKFITRFARIYTPAVVVAAIVLALLPPLVRILMGLPPIWGTWLYRALIFLVISCPCALVVSIPLGFFAGIGGASRKGVLIKGANYLESLAMADTIVFDKTGTLTQGVFRVSEIVPVGITSDRLLQLAASAEQYSTHPIALSILDAADDVSVASQVEEIAGRGVMALVDGQQVYAGNARLMVDAGVGPEGVGASADGSAGAEDFVCEATGTVIHVAADGKYLGHIVISDQLKEHSRQAINEIRKVGVRRTVMLTGDQKSVAEIVARELGIDNVYSQLLPQDKVSKVEELIAAEGDGENRNTVGFVGDGINDAPVLSRADVGIAMGAMGSDAAVEAADVVLMDDDPLRIVTAIRIARKCMRIVKQNIWFAIGIKLLCLVLGAVGIANMWLAIFADVGVLVLAVLNAIRCMSIRDIEEETI
jgi:Cd2+/Zn2+-exporting ATPase